MNIIQKKLSQLCKDDQWLFSCPLLPERYGKLAREMRGYPLLLVDSGNRILFGVDYYDYLVQQGVETVDVANMDMGVKEVLFLNYNLKEKFTGINLYEKLVFIKKILPLAEQSEIYSETGLDVAINPLLEKNLDTLLTAEFRELLVAEQVTLKAALGLCRFAPGDRAVLLKLFSIVAFTVSHQLRILEMCEEILFRDKCPLAEIFSSLAIEEMQQEEKPQRKIIDALFKHRNPVYWEYEKQWQEELKKLAIPANMQVTHYPFFEKRQIDVTLRVNSIDELKSIVAVIKDDSDNLKSMGNID